MRYQQRWKKNGKLVNKMSSHTPIKSYIKQDQTSCSEIQFALHCGTMQFRPPVYPKILVQYGGASNNKLDHFEKIKSESQDICLHKHVQKTQFQCNSIGTIRNQSRDKWQERGKICMAPTWNHLLVHRTINGALQVPPPSRCKDIFWKMQKHGKLYLIFWIAYNRCRWRNNPHDRNHHMYPPRATEIFVSAQSWGPTSNRLSQPCKIFKSKATKNPRFFNPT